MAEGLTTTTMMIMMMMMMMCRVCGWTSQWLVWWTWPLVNPVLSTSLISRQFQGTVVTVVPPRLVTITLLPNSTLTVWWPIGHHRTMLAALTSNQLQCVVHLPSGSVSVCLASTSCFLAHHTSIVLYPVSQRTGHPAVAHNFAKCWPIFTILSLSDSAVNA